MQKRGIAGSRMAPFQRHKVTLQKKSLRAAEQKLADVPVARRRWIREQSTLDTTRLVFIDETAANTKMLRLSGRCLRGDRLVGHVPYGHWKDDLAYVEQYLVPTLKRNDIVVIDNLPAHKVSSRP